MSRYVPALLAGIVAAMAASLWLSIGDPEGLVGDIVVGIWLLAMGGIGSLVAWRRPKNPVGWLMLAISAALTLHGLATSYAVHSLVEGHRLPGDMFAAWLTLWLLVPGFALFVHLLLLFPSGAVPSPRWKWVLRLANVMLVMVCVVPALEPGPIDYIPRLSNPIGLESAAWLISAVGDLAETLLLGLALTAVASVVVRFKKASGVEREQVKWFVYAIALIPLLGLLSVPVDAIDGEGDSYGAFAVNMTAALLIPLSLGVAILRKRLYDIDVIVNRTLVYGVLTALLAAAYLGSVVVLQQVLTPFAAESDLATAVSTLAVAGLFRPLRGGVQTFIDRRFYRKRYDAASALEGFSTRLRDEIELRSLSGELIAVVGETMQPAHASLWLRSGGVR